MMKNLMKKNSKGFSLIELLISMGIFTVVTGAAFMLYQRHQVLFSQEQDVVALSLDVRNALSQIQIDMSNAGAGVFPGISVGWPIGVTVLNSAPGGGCNPSTQAYDATCFDQMHIIAADLNVLPARPTNAAGAPMVTTSGQVSFTPPVPLLPAVPLTLAATAAQYRVGDVILFVEQNGLFITAAQLTANGAVAGARVVLNYVPTAANGTGADPYSITANLNGRLGSNFSNVDWLVKLRAVSYQVDVATDPTNPRLTRTQAGVTDVVTDQVIGFKIGVSLFNVVTNTSSEAYNFNACSYGSPAVPPACPGPNAFDYTLIRSVRLMMVGRTRPSTDPGYRYRNQFDNGRYQIQPVSLVVNPRNLGLN